MNEQALSLEVYNTGGQQTGQSSRRGSPWILVGYGLDETMSFCIGLNSKNLIFIFSFIFSLKQVLFLSSMANKLQQNLEFF